MNNKFIKITLDDIKAGGVYISLSYCVKEILSDHLDYGEITHIISGTKIDLSSDEAIMNWANNDLRLRPFRPEAVLECIRKMQQEWESISIIQPRMDFCMDNIYTGTIGKQDLIMMKQKYSGTERTRWMSLVLDNDAYQEIVRG